MSFRPVIVVAMALAVTACGSQAPPCPQVTCMLDRRSPARDGGFCVFHRRALCCGPRSINCGFYEDDAGGAWDLKISDRDVAGCDEVQFVGGCL